MHKCYSVSDFIIIFGAKARFFCPVIWAFHYFNFISKRLFLLKNNNKWILAFGFVSYGVTRWVLKYLSKILFYFLELLEYSIVDIYSGKKSDYQIGYHSLKCMASCCLPLLSYPLSYFSLSLHIATIGQVPNLNKS